MVATDSGQVTPYALDNLFDRGAFFVAPGDEVYEGQIVGEHCKDRDVLVNATKSKQLNNMRASGKDESARVKPPRKMSLEAVLEYIEDDELVEVCPSSIRMRKKLLKEGDRRRSERAAKKA